MRVASTHAAEVLAVLRQRNTPRGPVLANVPRRTVEVMVPTGTADVWPALPHTRCVARPTMRFPHPSVTTSSGLRPVDGRIWLTAPSAGTPAATDPDALAEAVAVALSRITRYGASPHDQRHPKEGH
ncbi:hypothetical protein ACFW5W_28420 [Streptomyces sp. NPDC058783]|uniref:hypothetical protein n=1 Tax=Streptomyces sp. NPDC058783 TaxID=3346633 RepID=UPI0036C4A94E